MGVPIWSMTSKVLGLLATPLFVGVVMLVNVGIDFSTQILRFDTVRHGFESRSE